MAYTHPYELVIILILETQCQTIYSCRQTKTFSPYALVLLPSSLQSRTRFFTLILDNQNQFEILTVWTGSCTCIFIDLIPPPPTKNATENKDDLHERCWWWLRNNLIKHWKVGLSKQPPWYAAIKSRLAQEVLGSIPWLGRYGCMHTFYLYPPFLPSLGYIFSHLPHHHTRGGYS